MSKDIKATLYCRVSTLEQIKGEFSSFYKQKDRVKCAISS